MGSRQRMQGNIFADFQWCKFDPTTKQFTLQVVSRIGRILIVRPIPSELCILTPSPTLSNRFNISRKPILMDPYLIQQHIDRLYLQVKYRLYLQVKYRLYLQVKYRLYLQLKYRLYLQVKYRLHLQVRYRLYLQVKSFNYNRMQP